MCDEFVSPSFADVPGCTGPRGSDRWTGGFDGVAGLLAGAAAGYGLRRRFPDRLAGRFRMEDEYFHRAAVYDQASGVSFHRFQLQRHAGQPLQRPRRMSLTSDRAASTIEWPAKHADARRRPRGAERAAAAALGVSFKEMANRALRATARRGPEEGR